MGSIREKDLLLTNRLSYFTIQPILTTSAFTVLEMVYPTSALIKCK